MAAAGTGRRGSARRWNGSAWPESTGGRYGYPAFDRVSTFGRDLDVPGGEAALIGTGLLTVLVVRADRTYLVAGLVQPAVLERVAADLAGATA